jgi:4-amino-4-deoxychorismate lyase
VHYPTSKPFELKEVLPAFDREGKHKFRVVYDHLQYVVEHAPYQPKDIRSMKIVEADELDYSFKYANRNVLNGLVKQAGSDEIIIVKDGLLTDASYANIACFDGHKWWTPEHPLLNGVRRQDLLSRGILFERRITSNDLYTFDKVCLINAMLDLCELTIPTSVIKWN